MQSIGFIGLGNMGGNMAARYLAAGYTVYGEDRDREHAQWLVDQGLRWVDTPRALAETADQQSPSAATGPARVPRDSGLFAVVLAPRSRLVVVA